MRYTLSEEERRRRRAATAAMAKCPCGNIARHGQTRCGACEAEHSARYDLIRSIEALDPSDPDFGADLRAVLMQIIAERG